MVIHALDQLNFWELLALSTSVTRVELNEERQRIQLLCNGRLKLGARVLFSRFLLGVRGLLRRGIRVIAHVEAI